ncbi:MAG: adenylate/guanylate cyclase domain-containing protein [Spirochaetota bacterium]
MKYIFSLLLASLLCYCQKPQTIVTPLAKKGILDLENWNFSKYGTLSLEGEWKFFWKELVTSQEASEKSSTHILVPHAWNSISKNGKQIYNLGYASYYLRMKAPQEGFPHRIGMRLANVHTSYKLFINHKLILENGKIGKKKSETTPLFLPKVVYLEIDNPSADIEILLQVANFSHRNSGMKQAIVFGRESDIQERRERGVAVEIFLFGSLFIMGMYHIGLFLLRKNDKSPLYFGLFCILIGYRSLTQGEKYITHLFPQMEYSLNLKLEYITFYLGIPTFLMYLYELYRSEFHKWIVYAITGSGYILTLLAIFLPAYLLTLTLMSAQILAAITILYIIYSLIQVTFKKRETSKTFLAFFLIFAASIVNDILVNQQIIQSIPLASFGLFFFIFGQAFLLSIRFSSAFHSVEILSDHLSRTNEAYSRFVPQEFLSYLEKNSILDVELGDQIQKEMTVLFCDIRSFTSLSESLSPRENFDFLNSYLKRMAPIVSRNNGFIDKFIGDAIMALFPNNPEDAIQAAIEMQKSLLSYNSQRQNYGYRPISIGIGIHTGQLMLGIVGAEKRMESTVISDAVNLASRIEGLNKKYNSKIICSQETFDKLSKPEKYQYKHLKEVTVQGKQQNVRVVEIIVPTEQLQT